MQSLVDNGMQNAGKNGPAIKAVTAGTMHAIIGGVDYNCYVATTKENPDHIAIYYPKSGTVINPRPALIIGNAAHPNNAKRFMDYLLSDEAQKLVADEMLLPGRKDIKADSRRTQYADINQFTGLDWNVMASQGKDLADELVNAIKNHK